MSINDFRNELENLRAHKERIFSQMVEDIKYITGRYFKVSDIINVEISEPDANVCIKYAIQNDEYEEDNVVEFFEVSIPTQYIINRDKFMKDLKEQRSRSKRQNLELMINLAKDQLNQYEQELKKLNE